MQRGAILLISSMKHYITKSGATIIVGRNSRENEKLTFEIAKAHDLWFHASNVQGAHVILTSPDNKHTPDDIQYAANLAAEHSNIKKIYENMKNNSNYMVQVNYCKVIDVLKPKHAPCGTVSLMNYNIINTTPYSKVSSYKIIYYKK